MTAVTDQGTESARRQERLYRSSDCRPATGSELGGGSPDSVGRDTIICSLCRHLAV